MVERPPQSGAEGQGEVLAPSAHGTTGGAFGLGCLGAPALLHVSALGRRGQVCQVCVTPRRPCLT